MDVINLRGHRGEEDGPHPVVRTAIAVILVAAIALSLVAITVQLAEFDVKTTVGGQAFVLESDWTAGEVTYTGSAPDFGVNVTGEQRFLTGMGGFQEKVGFLKGTAKERTNSITPYTTDFLGKRATLNVTVRAETIPWWVVGVAVPCQVEVELVEHQNVSSLTVDRVYIEFRRTVDGRVQTMEAWAKEVSDPMEELGQVRTYGTDIQVPEDWGRFDLFGMVNVTMVDTDDVTAEHVYRSYSSEPKAITLWTVSTFQGAKIAMVVVALPVFLLGAFLAVMAILAVLRDTRYKLVLAVGAGVCLFLGALFFHVGVSEMANLVGYPDDLTFTSGYTLMVGASLPALVAAVLVGAFITRDEEEGAGAPSVAATVDDGEKDFTEEDTLGEEEPR